MHNLGIRNLRKMNGLGNEIVVLDLRDANKRDRITGSTARAIGALPGFAFDQLMVIEPPDDTARDARLAIFNIDGSRAEACGNGTRCVAAAMRAESGSNRFSFESDAGPLQVWAETNGLLTVDMGPPRLRWDEIPLAMDVDTARVTLMPSVPGAPAHFTAVGMGNPHAVFFVDDAAAIDLAQVGPAIEHHPAFPTCVNVSFAQRTGPAHVLLRVWERGAGATRACGTAACATLVAAARTGVTGRTATVTLPGGDLRIAWRGTDDHVLMTGPAEFEFARPVDFAALATEVA